MAHKVTMDAHDLDFEITTSADKMLSIDSAVISEFIKLARQFNQIIPMSKIRFDRVGITNGFNYVLTAKDGRTWNQHIIVDSDDALMDFDVTDHWRVTEFSGHRLVRDLAVQMAFSHGVDKIKLDWK